MLAVLLFMAAAVVAAPPRKYNDEELRLVSRLASRVLIKNHYRGDAPDKAMSRRFYEKYVKTLDPERIYFTDADLAPFEARGDGICRKLMDGDCKFAFELYDLFRRRNREFREFAAEMLKHEIDFTVDEYYQSDRSKAPRPKNDAERRELWRLRIKNDVLYFRMIDRMLKEEKAKENSGAKTASGGKVRKDKKDRKKPAESPAWNKTPVEREAARLRDVGNIVDKREPIDILGMYINALANALGPHSNYSPPSTADDFEIHMSLTLTGIGATLTNEDGFIKVVELIPGGPAALDGRLKVNDRIIAVTEADGKSTDLIDMPVDRAVRYIRGEEKTRVRLTVLPGEKGRNATPVIIDLVRAKIQLKEGAAKGKVIEVAGADGKKRRIGVVTLPGFYMDVQSLRHGDRNARRCSRDMARILEDFKRRKVDAVVVDVRFNPGGILPEAVSCSGLFMTTAPVVQVKYAKRNRELLSDEDPSVVYSGPLVVLISKGSASSSEIFCGALRDNKRAVIVGDSRTFGKGTVLQVEELKDSLRFLGIKIPAGLLTYECAMFFRVAGGSPQQLGVASDVVIPSLSEEMKLGEMFYDHHLPWDEVEPIASAECDPGLERKIPELRRRSAARVAASKEFAALRRKIELYRHYRDRDKLSLNEERRWREYQQEKDAEAEAEKFDGEGKTGDDEADPVLDEAARIAADLAELGGGSSGKTGK